MKGIASYLVSHYKGVYRLRTEYDKESKQFPREYDGRFAENDIYIDCYKGRIYHYGNRTLEYYTDSKGRGRNIVKAIQSEFGDDIIFHIEETDSELLFRFNAKYMERLEYYLKPKTNGANISPFSSKNLPKLKYSMPDEDLNAYKEMISNIPQNQLISLVHTTKSFIQSLSTKKNTYDDIKADMAIKGLKGKEYIHSIGKWTEYINYLKTNLREDN